MSKVLLGLLTVVGLTSTVFAYDADCSLGNGKHFNIVVQNKVMVVDHKWKVFYKGKSWTGWYEYENKGYKYVVGTFDGGQFPIEVTNKYQDETSSGTCYFN